MKRIIIFLAIIAFIWSCGGGDSNTGDQRTPPKSMIPDAVEDDGKGLGEIKEVKLNNPLSAAMVERGKGIYEMKCAACHKLSAQRVVGPGWEGLTSKRKPEWIMNMITNVEMMLAEDPTAQALLEECLIRMPNQNLSSSDARDVLEFMYSIDGKEVGQ